MKQLHMKRPLQAVAPCALPAGYVYESYTGAQAQIEDWLRLCYPSLIPSTERTWFESCIVQYPDLCPAQDLFFVTEQATGRRVATSAAVYHAARREGYIHMVAADPCVSGKGIGRAMLAFALEELQKRGCTYTVLTTDDFRLPAIKLYLDGGFCPVLVEDPESDMQQRWEQVIATLGYDRKVTFLPE